MNDKDDKQCGEPNPVPNSQELFEEIFKQATIEIKIEKEGQAQSQKYSPVIAPGRSQQQKKSKDGEKRILKPSGPAPRKSGKTQSSLPGKVVRAHPNPRSTVEEDESTRPPERKRKTDRRNVKRSVAPKATVLVLLLAIMTGIIVSYLLGGLDIPLLLDYFKFGHEQVVTPAPGPANRPAIPPEKAIGSPKQPQGEDQNTAKTKDESKAQSPAPPQASLAPGVKGEEEIPPVASSDRPNVPGIAAKQEPQPSPVQTEISSKLNASEIIPSQLSAPKYPYSVYLGSFKAADAVKKAMSEYQEKGLSPYWAKVDLGDKGVWFRFFAGYFRTEEEAEKFIRERNLQGASPGTTRYANLIGTYSSDKKIEDNRRALESAGFYLYVIRGPDGKNFLYSGAFDRREYAEKEQTILASKGIKSETTER